MRPPAICRGRRANEDPSLKVASSRGNLNAPTDSAVERGSLEHDHGEAARSATDAKKPSASRRDRGEMRLEMACPGGFEPPASASARLRSVRLSYGQVRVLSDEYRTRHLCTRPAVRKRSSGWCSHRVFTPDRDSRYDDAAATSTLERAVSGLRWKKWFVGPRPCPSDSA